MQWYFALCNPGFLFLYSCLLCSACGGDVQSEAQQTIDGAPVADIVRIPIEPSEGSASATVQFEESSFDFDTISGDTTVFHNFRFTNIGQAPLLIASVKSTCGCTVPSWTEEVIPPEKSGEISVAFNSKGRMGRFIKSIEVLSNARPARATISIKGFITSDLK